MYSTSSSSRSRPQTISPVISFSGPTRKARLSRARCKVWLCSRRPVPPLAPGFLLQIPTIPSRLVFLHPDPGATPPAACVTDRPKPAAPWRRAEGRSLQLRCRQGAQRDQATRTGNRRNHEAVEVVQDIRSNRQWTSARDSGKLSDAASSLLTSSVQVAVSEETSGHETGVIPPGNGRMSCSRKLPGISRSVAPG